MNLNDLFKKIIVAKSEKRLVRALNHKIFPYLKSLKYIFYWPKTNIQIHCPDYIAPIQDSAEIKIVERIFESYKKMKNDQISANEVFLPSSLWQGQLNQCFSSLNESIEEDSIDKFHFFLSNFGSWKKDHGIESGVFIRKMSKTPFTKFYLKKDIFLRNIKTWKWIYNSRKPLSDLSYPTYGNQSGAYINGNFVGIGSTFNEVYGSIIKDIVSDIKRPVVAEIGAGYGKLAFFSLNNVSNFCYIDFDLPETLCLASYYLMKSWPNKRVLLYGEEEYSLDMHNKYDLIFLPSFAAEKLEDNSIDIFLNQNSLGEMLSDTAHKFIQIISKSTKEYFFHLNHDNYQNIFEDNSSGLLASEYPLDMEKFKLMFRYPDLGHLTYRGKIDYYMDIFVYLYQVKKK